MTPPQSVPQVLTQHREPVTAVVPAAEANLRDTGKRLDVHTVLRDGARITLACYPDTPGRMSEDGYVAEGRRRLLTRALAV